VAITSPGSTRIEIVIEVDDKDAAPLFVWAAARAARLVEELASRAMSAELVRIDVTGDDHYAW
jgi:hypothetical protein